MNHFPRTRGRGRLSFTSNASLPPSYQSNVSSTHSSAQGRSLGTSSPDTVSDISFGSEAALPGPRYVYYRVYSPAGGVEVKNPEFPNDPYLGRALAIRLTPPHTIASVRHHICGRERITDHRNIRLFDNILSRTPLNDSKPVNILDRAGVGSTSGEPFVLVMLELASAGYPYKLKAHLDIDVGIFGWLVIKKGDILHTDGVPIKDPKYGSYDGFNATNDATQTSGFVMLTYTQQGTCLEFVGPSPTLPMGFDPSCPFNSASVSLIRPLTEMWD